MAAPVTVYGPMISPAVARVAACLLEKDVPFQVEPVDMSKGEHKSPSFLKLQPFGQVPAFKDSLTTVFESRAICRYICDQYADSGNKTLMGRKEDGAVGRAAIEKWIEAEGQSFNPPSLAMAFQLAFVPFMGRATDMAVVEQNEAKLVKVLDVYEQWLGENQYFAGDEFSLADLVHMPNTDLLVRKTNKAGLFTERKNLARWWDEVSARPSWKKVVELQNVFKFTLYLAVPLTRSSIKSIETMAAGLQVFGQPASTDVARVLTCLFEKDLEFELVRIDTFKREHKLPEFIKLRDPNGQVTFKHGDKTIVDSRAICRYVCTQFPEGNKTLYGTGSLERASIEQWLQAEAQNFSPPSSALVFHLAFAPHLNIPQDHAVIAENEKKLQQVLNVYDEILSKNEYLAGDEFTLADLSHLPNSHYIVFGQPASTDVARVLTCLFEKNLEFELIRIDTFKKEHKLPEFIKLRDPTGQVTFKHGGKTLVDSRAICRYLCTQFPDDGNRTIYGTGSLERASIEQWLQAEAQSFDAPSSELVFHLAFAPQLNIPADEARIAENERKLQQMLNVYDEILAKNKYLAGDEFTLADLSHLPNSHYIVNARSPRGKKLFTSKKHVARWYEEISNRASWKQVVKMQSEHPGAFE
uniref:glutathione transferase n=1 Tax=Oryza meridionalis TaxID=40149 RepID=A0A0E0CUS6_9ORYZ